MDKSIDKLKVLYTVPAAPEPITYQLEQEHIDKLFKNVHPYTKPILSSYIDIRRNNEVYYERKRGNSDNGVI